MGCAKLDGSWICGERVVPCECGEIATLLCDYPLGKGKTCDAPLCEGCGVPLDFVEPLTVGDKASRARRRKILEDRHLCPTHYAIGRGVKADG